MINIFLSMPQQPTFYLYPSQQLSKELEGKKDTMKNLEEKVSTLEQRLQDHSLSGDEKLSAVSAEVRIGTSFLKVK